MVDMVSQFEADDIYSQINYKGNPVRVTPLKYANLIKWFTNQGEGIPAYIRDQYGKSVYGACKTETGYEIYNK